MFLHAAELEFEHPATGERLAFTRRCPTICSGSWMGCKPKPSMPRRFELVVFDQDGTLIDLAGAIAACIQWPATSSGCPYLTTSARSRSVSALSTPRRAVPSPPPSGGRLAERYRVHFLARDAASALPARA
jgi:hypothetical protein